PSPRHGVDLLVDRVYGPDVVVDPSWLRASDDSLRDFPLCRGKVCYAGRATPCQDVEGCSQHIQIKRIAVPMPLPTQDEFERSATLEVTIASNSGRPSYSSV